jgi:hypothetical protein
VTVEDFNGGVGQIGDYMTREGWLLERRTAAHLQNGLSKNGFTVDVAYDGFEASQLARAGAYAPTSPESPFVSLLSDLGLK